MPLAAGAEDVEVGEVDVVLAPLALLLLLTVLLLRLAALLPLLLLRRLESLVLFRLTLTPTAAPTMAAATMPTMMPPIIKARLYFRTLDLLLACSTAWS